jgi:hypothetical protein
VRWTNSRDGRKRVTVRAEYRLDEQNLTDILCYSALAYGWDLDAGDPNLAWLKDQVRAELASHGMGAWPYWRDELPDDETAAKTTAWAVRQVARLSGTMRTGDTR